MGNILLTTQGTGGDVYPFIKIGQMLKALGHQVKLITNHQHKAKVKSNNLDYAALDDMLPFREWSAREKLPDIIASRQRYMMQKTLEMFENIRRLGQQKDSILVGHYGLHLPSQTAADKMLIPYIPIFTAPYFMLNTAILGEMYHENSQSLNQMRTALALPPVDDWDAWLRQPSISIGLWPEWFAAPERGWPSGLEMVGFVSSDDVEQGELPPDVEDFLERGEEPPVLVTHGTSRPSHAEFFEVCVEACARLGRRCIIVTNDEELVPADLDQNTRYYKYLPFGSLMPRMGAIIHHGGIGTSSRALAAGVPQLILAFGSDRPDNASRLKGLKVAEHLPPARWNQSVIAETLGRLMRCPNVRESCSGLSRRFERDEPAGGACRVIESVLPDARPSAKSATTQHTTVNITQV